MSLGRLAPYKVQLYQPLSSKTSFEEKKCHRCDLYTAHKLLYFHCWEGKSGVWWLEVPNSHTNTLLIRQTNVLCSCSTFCTCSWPLQDEGNGLLPNTGPFNQPGIYVDLTLRRQKGFYNQGDNSLGQYSYQAPATSQHVLWLEFQKEQTVSLEARRVTLLGEILGKRCNIHNAPHKKTDLWALLPCFILDTDSFLFMVLAALNCERGWDAVLLL